MTKAKLVSLALASAFGSATPQTLPVAGVQITTPTPLNVQQLKRVTIKDPAIFALQDFSLQRTIGKILESKGGAAANTQAAREAFLQSMLDSLNATSLVNPVSGLAEQLTPRTGEASLPVAEMFDPNNSQNGVKPIFITMRFDLADDKGLHCGEYRIGYALRSGETNPQRRMTYIFEGAAENPSPELGADGCKPITNFWAAMSGKTTEQMAMGLEKFFYKGLPAVNGDPAVKPIVDAKHYGQPFGQVRTNMFVNAFFWELREFSVKNLTGGSMIFKPQPVADTALAALYEDDFGLPEDPIIKALRPQFQDFFISTMLPRLTAVDVAASKKGVPSTDTNLFFKLADGPIPTKFNSFRSVAENSQDLQAHVGQSFGTRIQDAIPPLGISYPLDRFNIAARAAAMTCAGCHQTATQFFPIAPGSVAGPSVVWPQSLTFVHFDESGNASPLLTDRNEPARHKNLMNFVNGTVQIKPLAQEDLTAVILLNKIRRGESTAQVALPANPKADPAFQEFLTRLKRLGSGMPINEDREIALIRDQERAMPGVFGPRRSH